MSLKKKNLHRNEMQRVLKKSVTTEKYHDSCFQGIICLVTFHDVSEKLVVNNPNGAVKIVDQGISWLEFLPEHGNWCLTAMFDEHHQLFECYFDISKDHICDVTNPSFTDLELDVIVTSGKKPVIVDEDELSEALQNGDITKTEYELAYHVANEICEICSKDAYIAWIEKQYIRLLERQNLNVRLATQQDLPIITRLYTSVIQKMEQKGIYLWDDVYPMICIPDDIRREQYYLVESGDSIVGGFALCDTNEDSGAFDRETHAKYLERFAISPEYQTTGISMEIMERIKQMMEGNALHLFVERHNIPAIRLYEKAGLKRMDGIFREKIDDSVFLEEYGYEWKRID